MKNIFIYNHDIQKYPPILSAIRILLSLKKKVVIIGYCSDIDTIYELESQGVTYYEIIFNNTSDNKFKKTLKLYLYRKKVKRIVTQIFEKKSILWIYGNQNIWLLYELIYKFKSILYLFETPELRVSFRYRLLSPFLDYTKAMQSAWKVVCCEYNRAHITKAYFNLAKLPMVIPNKPDFDMSQLRNVVEDKIENLFKSKKIILYQGIFNYPERRLNELCESIMYLPKEYVICIMGGYDTNKEKLIEKYQSERVVFIDFIPAPRHLEVTKKAFVGFLSYFPNEGEMSSVINTLYCAPNKIYEYSCFGIPMLANDVPALTNLFEKYNAGKTVSEFGPKEIATAILEIGKNYNDFKKGSSQLYKSVDISNLINKLIN